MISLNWIKDYVDIENEDLKELAVKITKAGVNVEKVITNHIDNLTVGEVISCEEHPDSDHLHCTKVNVITHSFGNNIYNGFSAHTANAGERVFFTYIFKPVGEHTFTFHAPIYNIFFCVFKGTFSYVRRAGGLYFSRFKQIYGQISVVRTDIYDGIGAGYKVCRCL